MYEVAQRPVQEQKPAARERSRWRPVLAWTLSLALLAAAIYYGVGLRRWAWDQTTDIRFINSVSNAIEWGNYSRQNGVLDVYDVLFKKFGPEGEYGGGGRFALDYPPLRLFIAYAWTNWAYDKYQVPQGQTLTWKPEYAFTEPMLRLNMACELLAMAGMFCLVYRWMRVCALPAPDRWWTWRITQGWGRTENLKDLRQLPSTVGLRAATTAALLIWFNPSVIYNAHVYPQWDVWLIPPVIWAAFFALMNWWLPAGLAIGICAMTKGQILLAAPLFVAWPLLLGNVTGALRLAAGFAAGVAMIVWPWMVRTDQTQLWMTHVGAAAMLIGLAGLLPRGKATWWALRIVLALVGIVVLCMPVGGRGAELLFYAIALGLLASLAALIGSRWWTATSLAALAAGGLALTVPLFNASLSWYEIGIKYGTRHWKQLFWCLAPNLGSILQIRFQWKYADIANMSWVPWLNLGQMPIREVMIWLYGITLAICVIGAVRHRRNHDPRFFVALAAPLMLAYALLPQMIERYMIWPAAILSAYAAISVGGFLLWLAISAIATWMMFGYMLQLARQSTTSREWFPTVQATFPDIGWAVLVLAGVMLCLSVSSSARRTNATALPLEPLPEPRP